MPNNNYYQGIASDLSNQGRYGDSMLMHVNPAEVQGLASAFPGKVTINPETGLPEAFALIPALLMGAAIGGITNLATGSQTPIWQSILMGAAGSALTGGLGSALGGGTAAVTPAVTPAVTEAAIATVPAAITPAVTAAAPAIGLGAAAELTAAQIAEQAALKTAEEAALSSALSAVPPPSPFSPIGQNLSAVGIGDGLGAGGIGQGVGINPAGQGIGAGGIGDGLPSYATNTLPSFEPGPYTPEPIFGDPGGGLTPNPLDTPHFADVVQGLDPSYTPTIGESLERGLGDSNIFGENYGFTEANMQDYFTSLQPLGAFGFPLLFEEDDYGFDDVPATEHDEFWTV